MANQKKKIPGEVTLAEFKAIEDRLADILHGEGAQEVHLRLNESGWKELAPVFVGWVESTDLRDERVRKNKPAPGLFRFGDTVFSSIYEAAYKAASRMAPVGPAQPQYEARAVEKDWVTALAEKYEEEKSLVAKAGVRYQLAVGLIVGGYFVGTLNIGTNATKSAQFRGAVPLTTGPIFQLVQWLDQNFELSGPKI
ncbi:MAG: hypothetical protein HYT78_17285 [Deltaproteobacteria bacterium]|nr:hypothetical protein [Deltaproteobacteria bacterium]